MWDIFVFAFCAVMPIILLILLGYFIKRIGLLKQDFFKQANTLVFKVCLPCLLFINVYSIESFSSIDWSVVIFAEAAIFIIFILGFIFVKLFIKDDRQKGVILQCVYRSNFAIIGLSLASSLGKDAGTQVAALLSAFSIPTFNVLAIIALTIFIKSEEKKSFSKQLKTTLLKIVKNPLIIGVVCGLICLGIRQIIRNCNSGELVFSLKDNLPPIYNSIKNVSVIASPLALIVLGGLFEFSATKDNLKEIIIGVSARVLIVPALVLTVAILLSNCTSFFNFDNTVYPAYIALFGTPVAVASAIMAEQMDNDGPLATQLVVWTSLSSIVTIFLFVVVLRSMGLL